MDMTACPAYKHVQTHQLTLKILYMKSQVAINIILKFQKSVFIVMYQLFMPTNRPRVGKGSAHTSTYNDNYVGCNVTK